MFSGFKKEKISIEDQGYGLAEITFRHGGSGEPLLLLHGNPMSHVTWHKIVDDLKSQFYIVAADLRGYGESIGPEDGGKNHINYSFRAMAKDQIYLMDKLGFSSFRLAGHDRGARTAHRMALDAPEKIKKLAIFDIMPNHHIWTVQKKGWSISKWHWLLMMQPYDLPEKMLSSVPPDYYMRKKLSKRGANLDFCKETFNEYVKCFNYKTIRGSCEDYRASPSCDLDMDNFDYQNENKIKCPILVLWGNKSDTGKVWGEVLEVWETYSDIKPIGQGLDCGHYLQEEKPSEVINWFKKFF